MYIYLAGPMRGKPEFNFPAFKAAAAYLRACGHTVFNPAERDEGVYGADFAKGNATGDERAAIQGHGFSLREALAADTQFICLKADAIALLPDWEGSSGANAEWTLSKALGLQFIYLNEDDYAIYRAA